MLTGWRKQLFYLGAILLTVGISFLIVPQYVDYCQNTYANYKYCSAYEISSAIGGFLESHNEAITAIATAFIGYFTYTLYRATTGLVEAAKIQSSSSLAAPPR